MKGYVGLLLGMSVSPEKSRFMRSQNFCVILGPDWSELLARPGAQTRRLALG